MSSPRSIPLLSIQFIPSDKRQHIKQGWLEAFHSHQHLPRNSPLRVVNEDCVERNNNGFASHPHQNYEIFTYMLSGELSHYDSMGNAHRCRFGTVQFTSAGSGMFHSELNKHPEWDCKLLQIWVKPRTLNTPPRYQKIEFSNEKRLNQLCLMIVPKELISSIQQENFPNEEIIGMDQDFFALSSLLQFGHLVRHELRACRRLFIHVPFWGNNEKFHSKEKLLQIIIKKELNEYSEKEQEEPLIELGPGDSCLLTNENVALFGKSLEIVFKTKELMDQASRETTNAIDSFLEFVVFDMIVHSNSSH